ncbi:hypothetical protein LR004_01310 [Candidatus Gracilibacteria bacterium]|nr:hypothetical protein [Candidatus Gracilibacteria bacterium]
MTPNKILVSSPSFYNAFLGYLIRITYKKSILWVDLRDEWASHSHIHYHKRFRRLVEKLIIRKSDIVTTVSNNIKRKLENKHNRKNITLLYNYEASSPLLELDKLFFDRNSTNFLYIGTMPNGYYDESLFLEFMEKNKYERYHYYFVGFSGNLESIFTDKYKSITSIIPKVTHKRAMQLMRNADVLLFFAYNASDNNGIVSTKIFEYINSGTPILPFSVKKGSDIDSIFIKSCGKSLYLNSASDMEKITDDFDNILPKKNNNDFVCEMKNIQSTLIDKFLYES